MIGQLPQPQQLPLSKQPQIVPYGRAGLLEVGGRLLQRQREIAKGVGKLIGGSTVLSSAATEERHRLSRDSTSTGIGVARAPQGCGRLPAAGRFRPVAGREPGRGAARRCRRSVATAPAIPAAPRAPPAGSPDRRTAVAPAGEPAPPAGPEWPTAVRPAPTRPGRSRPHTGGRTRWPTGSSRPHPAHAPCPPAPPRLSPGSVAGRAGP